MRLVDADALKKKLYKPFDWNNSPEEIQEQSDFNYFDAMIDAAPTIDAVPVVHASWVPVTGSPGNGVMLGCTAYRCSSCGRIEEENGEPYCHCGALMDGDTPQNVGQT